jgi:hypothetical protein
VDEYRQHRNLEPPQVIVEVTLVNGETIPIGGVRAAFGWVVLLAEDDSMRIVPYREIAAVDVHRRPGPPLERQTGFTYESISGEPQN